MKMRDLFLILAGAAALAVPATSALSTLPTAIPSPRLGLGGPVRVQPLATQKICQLIGEVDRQTGAPTINATESRFGFWGSDLGISVEHAGRLYFLFGDTHARPGLGRPHDTDLIASTADRDPERCLRLDVPRAEDGGYRPLTIPGVSSGAFEVPTGGFSANGKLYLIASTDNSPHRTMGRSVLAASEDDGASFTRIMDLSTDKFINVAATVIGSSEVPGLPTPPGGAVLMWGTGTYRASAPFLAISPSAQVENAAARRYFAGMESGLPRWSDKEADAVPLFQQSCMGEVSVAWNEHLRKWVMLYNCMGPGGRSQILMRSADLPWGPWAEPLIVFDPAVDGDCRFIQAGGPMPAGQPCAMVGDPHVRFSPGDAYGPYLIPSFSRPAPGGGVHIYFTMSTWNPYTVVLMRATLLQDQPEAPVQAAVPPRLVAY